MYVYVLYVFISYGKCTHISIILYYLHISYGKIYL